MEEGKERVRRETVQEEESMKSMKLKREKMGKKGRMTGEDGIGSDHGRAPEAPGIEEEGNKWGEGRRFEKR